MKQDIDQLIEDLDRRLNESSRFYLQAAARIAQRQMHQAVIEELETGTTEQAAPNSGSLPVRFRDWIKNRVVRSLELEGQDSLGSADVPIIIDVEARDVSDAE